MEEELVPIRGIVIITGLNEAEIDENRKLGYEKHKTYAVIHHRPLGEGETTYTTTDAGWELKTLALRDYMKRYPDYHPYVKWDEVYPTYEIWFSPPAMIPKKKFEEILRKYGDC